MLKGGESLTPQIIINMEEPSAPKTPVIDWSAITSQSFSMERIFSSDARDMMQRWNTVVELRGLMKVGIAGLKEEMEVIAAGMLVNNPRDVKDAAKRDLKRMEDLKLRMEMLKKESKVLNDLVKACSSTSKDRKRIISPPQYSSDKKTQE